MRQQQEGKWETEQGCMYDREEDREREARRARTMIEGVKSGKTIDER